MNKLILVLIGSLFLSLPSLALTTGQGVYYQEFYNKHGVRLTSNKEVIYLGRSCDAYSPKWGSGSWTQSNGGILVTFNNGITRGFPKQQVYLSENCMY